MLHVFYGNLLLTPSVVWLQFVDRLFRLGTVFLWSRTVIFRGWLAAACGRRAELCGRRRIRTEATGPAASTARQTDSETHRRPYSQLEFLHHAKPSQRYSNFLNCLWPCCCCPASFVDTSSSRVHSLHLCASPPPSGEIQKSINSSLSNERFKFQ